MIGPAGEIEHLHQLLFRAQVGRQAFLKASEKALDHRERGPARHCHVQCLGEPEDLQTLRVDAGGARGCNAAENNNPTRGTAGFGAWSTC